MDEITSSGDVSFCKMSNKTRKVLYMADEEHSMKLHGSRLSMGQNGELQQYGHDYFK